MKKHPCLSLFLLVLLVISYGQVFAKDYYFRPAIGSGAGFCTQGAGDGTSYDSPWLCSGRSTSATGHVQWAILGSGDTLYVCGLHDRSLSDSTIWPEASGDSTAPFTISGDCRKPDGTPDPGVLLGTGGKLTAGWSSPDEYGVYSQTYTGSTQNQMLEDPSNGTNTLASLISLKVRTDTPNAAWECGSFSKIGTTLYYKPSSTSGVPGECNAPHVVYPVADRTFYIKDQEHIRVEKLTVANSDLALWIDGGDYIEVRDSKVRFGITYGIMIQSLFAQTKLSNNHGKIINTEISNSANGIYAVRRATQIGPYEWIFYPNTYWELRGNYIHHIVGHQDSHCIGFQGGAIHNTIEQNHLHDCAGSGITLYNEAFGDQIKHNIIRYNFIHDIKKNGSIAGNQRGIEYGNTNCPQHPDDTVGNIVAYNVIRDVEGDGLYTKSALPTVNAESPYSWSFLNNVLYNTGQRAGAASFFWTQGAAYGEANYQGSGNSNPCASVNLIPELSRPGYRLQNNIFIDTGQYFIFPQLLNHPLLTGDYSGVIATNNLFYSSPGSGTGKFVWQTQEDVQSNNACVNAGGSIYFFQYACEFERLEDYANFSGKESASIAADPLLIDHATGDFHWAGTPTIIPGAGDYRLTANSPAIDRGTPVGLTTDIAGNPVQGIPDIGAYEGGALADVAVSANATPDPVNTDSPLSYSINVSNTGPSPATNVVLTHTLPSGVTGSGVPSQGSCTGTSVISCNLGTLTNGQGATVTVTATPNAEALFDPTPNTTFVVNISATTSVSATETDPVSGNNIATTATNVRLACLGQPVTKRGTSGNNGTSSNRFAGGSGADVIHTLSGNDWIDGKGGNDKICGGAGNDNLRGSGGADTLSGGSGTDVCNGGSGTDSNDGSCETWTQ